MRSPCIIVLLFFGSLLGLTNRLVAQNEVNQSVPDVNPFQDLDLLGNSGLPGQQSEITVFSQAVIDPVRRTGELTITAELAEGRHIYSITQPAGATKPTRLVLVASPDYVLNGSFVADPLPYVHQVEYFTVPLEEHHDRVSWSAPFLIKDNVDLGSIRIEGHLEGQICEGESLCKELNPTQTTFVADLQLSSEVETVATVTQPIAAPALELPVFKEQGSRLEVRGYIEPAQVVPGGKARLYLMARPDANYHIYTYADTKVSPFSTPTLIVVTQGFPAGRPQTDAKVEEMAPVIQGEPAIQYHEGEVTWTVDIHVPPQVEAGIHPFAGLIGYQTCTDSTCDLPRGLEFETEFEVVDKVTSHDQVPVEFRAGGYNTASRASAKRQARGDWPPTVPSTAEFDELQKIESLANSDSAETTHPSLTAYTVTPSLPNNVLATLGLAFLAGLILNVMPCVMPVIGLKIMAFVEQAGESRWRVFVLNLWYTLGLMSIFMVIASLVYFLQFGWGDQLRSSGFNVTLAAVVFTFGLSMLGLWEIPIPGFIGSGKGAELAQREGAAGAFCKGLLTTILATPCTGPLLIPVTAWAVRQPVWLNYVTFAVIGLGMASPYLLIGAFPALVRALPRPGNWMITFKQIMGFMLMATVVWIFSFLESSYRVPTLSLLLALAFACWWVGRTPATATFSHKLEAWVGSLVVVVAVAMVCFSTGKYIIPAVAATFGLGLTWLLFSRVAETHKVVAWSATVVVVLLATSVCIVALASAELPWTTFTRVALDEYRAQGQTVLVDFTADW